MRKEEQVAQEKKAAKQRANEEYHRSTAAANAAAKTKHEEDKQALWAEEAKLNAQWKAMLDKQEETRNAQYANLRERIHKMQRAYENSAGADLERRMREEEEANTRYVEAHERMLDEQAADKKARRQKDIHANVTFLKQQVELKQAARAEEKRRDREYAEEVQRDVTVGEHKDEERLMLRKARMAQQTAALNQQVVEQREQSARDPGSSEMTEIEAALNRPLLVSMVQHEYHANYANPLTG